MPVIDFTKTENVLIALLLFVLCLILSHNNKTNTVMAITLLSFLTILVGHVIELTVTTDQKAVYFLAKSIAIDEIFIFLSFLSFLWMDRIGIEYDKKINKDKTTTLKKGNKLYKDGKDGLDFLFKKV